jgi:hypothetical protein
VVLKTTVENTTSVGDDGIGSPSCPEHAGLFETRTDHGQDLFYELGDWNDLPSQAACKPAVKVPITS